MSATLDLPKTTALSRRLPQVFLPSEGSLFSPAADVMMAGGLSLVALLCFKIGLPNASSDQLNAFGWATYYLSFFINYPHFAASYQLIYADARPGFTDLSGNRTFALKLWWAGVLVPLILITYFVISLARDSATSMGLLVNVMFLTVGWHYVKQIFGCFVVLSSVRRIYFSALERRSVLAALYALWFNSWVASNQASGAQDYYGIQYTTAALPHWTLQLTQLLMVVTGIVAVVVIGQKASRQSVWPPASALVAVASVYAWLLPTTTTSMYILIVPAFHSLQYLLFVLAYKRNSVVAAQGLDVEDLTRGSADPATATLATVDEAPADQAPADLAGARRGRLTIAAYLAFLVLPTGVLLYTYLTKSSVALESWLRSLFFPSAQAGGAGLDTGVPRTTWLAIALATAVLLLFLVGANALVARRAYAGFATFFVTAVILGATLFGLAPTALDILNEKGLLPSGLSYSSAVFGTTLYLFFFTVFVNIHHYFIDNVIWKRDNPFVRSHLVWSRPKPASQTPLADAAGTPTGSAGSASGASGAGEPAPAAQQSVSQ